MCAWLKNLCRGIAPWFGCDNDFYIAAFRKQLDEIAKILSQNGGPPVHTRFSCGRECAEFYTLEDGVIARVEVLGKKGYPDLVRVASDLSSESEKVFVDYIPNLRVEFRSLIKK